MSEQDLLFQLIIIGISVLFWVIGIIKINKFEKDYEKRGDNDE